MAKEKLTLDVRGVPECVWEARRALADLLRREADETLDVMLEEKLREIAARFETGQLREVL